MTNYAKVLNPEVTPQNKRAREDQVLNSAGGYVFKTDEWTMLRRFLIIGAEGPTYYVSQQTLVEANAKNVIALIKSAGQRVVAETVVISNANRAPKQDPAIFVLALCMKYGDVKTRQAAHAAVPIVCRTLDHLASLANTRKTMKLGEGRGWRTAVASWYTEKSPRDLAYQVAKYKERQGWSHMDLIRISHAHTSDPEFNAIVQYLKTDVPGEGSPQILRARHSAMSEKHTPASLAKLVREHRLTHEMIPNDMKDKPEVWEALLDSMPVWATIRNLGKMSSIGLLGPLAASNKVVVERLTDKEAIVRSRIHPLTVLMALQQYRAGQGLLGSLRWTPAQPIIAALEQAFVLSFDAVEPTNQRVLIAVDISGSMNSPLVPPKQQLDWKAQNSLLTVRQAAAVLALVTAKREPNHHIIGYAHQACELDITANSDFAGAMSAIGQVSVGQSTDCALPMLVAAKHKYAVDAFVLLTDNETWVGKIHPHQALEQYRRQTGINAAMLVNAMTSTGFTIADPKDPRSLDVVGFDTAVPTIMSEFIKGNM